MRGEKEMVQIDKSGEMVMKEEKPKFGPVVKQGGGGFLC